MRLDGLTTRWLGHTLIYFDELGSTNTYVKEHAGEMENGTAVITKRQPDGRGRLGRGWIGEGGGLYLTLLLREIKRADLPPLPLAAGLAVKEALESAAGAGFALKWSNDVLYGDKKVCGILCESRLGSGEDFAAVGIGVNLTGSRADFDRHGLVYASSIEMATGKNITNLALAAEICNRFEPLLLKLRENGFESIRPDYAASCVTVGREVRVISGGAEKTGTALDIAPDGGLVCNIGGKLQTVRAGEASVRGLYGYADGR